MTRSFAIVLVLAACATSSAKRDVAPRAAPGDGTCREAGGCDAPIEKQARYELPDSEHPAPADPSYAPREIKEASCADVAQNLASIELGNYADDDKLRPTVAKHRAACAKLKLDKAERQCVFEATDRSTVTWCAARMTPGATVEVVPSKDCTALLDRMRTQSQAYRASVPQIDKQLAAVQTSCEQDRWTIVFRDCVRAVPYPGYVTQYCAAAGPPLLRKKLDDRLAQAK